MVSAFDEIISHEKCDRNTSQRLMQSKHFFHNYDKHPTISHLIHLGTDILDVSDSTIARIIYEIEKTS